MPDYRLQYSTPPSLHSDCSPVSPVAVSVVHTGRGIRPADSRSSETRQGPTSAVQKVHGKSQKLAEIG